MRKQILLAAAGFVVATATLATGGTPAMANANAPWCAQTREAGDALMCNFFSFRQCQSYVSGTGGICHRNFALLYESQAYVVAVEPDAPRYERRSRVRYHDID